MRLFLLFSLLIMISACASKPLKSTPIGGDFVASSPEMVVGDRWQYNSNTYDSVIEKEVIAVEENGNFTLKLTENGRNFYYVECDKDHNILSKKGTAPKTSVWKNQNFVQYPLFVGKNYSITSTSYSPKQHGLHDYILDFDVAAVAKEEFLGDTIYIYTINFSIYRPEDGWGGNGKIRYSPELKSIIKFDPDWRETTDVFSYHVVAGDLMLTNQDGTFKSVTTEAATGDVMLSFGYDNLNNSSETVALERKRIAEERAQLEKERLTAKQSQISRQKQFEAATALKLAEAERLAAAKLAEAKLEADRLKQEALASAAIEAQKLAKQKQDEALLAADRSNAARLEAERVAAEKLADENNQYGIAIIIGNRNYSKNNKDVPDVSYALNDAKAVYAYVHETLGYRKGNIIHIEDATQAEMTQVFGNERSHKGKLFNWTQADKSKIFVYYSGHGAPGLSDGAGYLLPVNADPMSVELNGYPLETLYANLAKIPAKQITVVLDACFSGSSSDGNLIKSASSISLKRVETKGVLKNGTVLTAADVSEVASWDNNRKMGLFTTHFLDGLKGAADRGEFGNGDGEIRLGELKKYLQAKVSYSARRNYYREQNPQVSGDEGLVLGTLN